MFLFLACLINYLLSYGNKLMMNESQLLASDRIMLSLQDSVELLLIGNSHSFNIRTDFLPKSVCIASYGEELHNTYYKLNYLLENQNVRPKTVIMSFDLGLLRPVHFDQQKYQYYWNDYENSSESFTVSEDKSSFMTSRGLSYLFPYMDAEVDAFDFLFADNETRDIAMVRDAAKVKQFDPSLKKVLNSACLDNQVTKIGGFYFEKLITLCSKYDINLVLIKYPISKSCYFEKSVCFDPDGYYRLINDEFIEGKYDKVNVLDYHDAYDFTNFRDPDHLKGGEYRERFTLKVKSDLVKLGIGY